MYLLGALTTRVANHLFFFSFFTYTVLFKVQSFSFRVKLEFQVQASVTFLGIEVLTGLVPHSPEAARTTHCPAGTLRSSLGLPPVASSKRYGHVEHLGDSRGGSPGVADPSGDTPGDGVK